MSCDDYYGLGYGDGYGDDGDYYTYDGDYDTTHDVTTATAAAAAGTTTGDVVPTVYSGPAMETISRHIVLDAINADVQRFADTFELSAPVSAALLQAMGWPLDPADTYLSSRDEVLRKGGLKLTDLDLAPHTIVTNDSGPAPNDCAVCFDAIEAGEGLALSTCGHFAHRECWIQHLTARAEGGYIFTTRCISCPELLSWQDMEVIVQGTDETTASAPLRAYLSGYLAAHPRFSVCVTDACDGVVHILRPLATTATLHCDRCGSEWCRACRGAPHHPARCTAITAWQTGNIEDGASLAFIHQATKPCPKCHRPIQKNSGCNHMTCTQPCKHEFCWICMGDWRAHTSGTAYSCTRVAPKEENLTTKQQNEDLLRLYYERVSLLKRSSEMEQRAIHEFLMQTSNNYTATYEPILRHLQRSLRVARDLVINGHIASFIQKKEWIDAGTPEKGNVMSSTEFRCGRVEGATEDLSRLLDQCVGTATSPGVLRVSHIVPADVQPVLLDLQQKLKILDGWCENVESEVS